MFVTDSERRARPFDIVEKPKHYADKQIEVIDYIRDTLDQSGFTDYCCGNVIKYISRWRKKGGVEDLNKAKVYLCWMIESAEEEEKGKDKGIKSQPYQMMSGTTLGQNFYEEDDLK